jgi:hypothetical protein
MISLLVACLSILIYAVQGVELHIFGSVTGNGSQSLVLVGDNITAYWDGFFLNATAVTP